MSDDEEELVEKLGITAKSVKVSQIESFVNV